MPILGVSAKYVTLISTALVGPQAVSLSQTVSVLLLSLFVVVFSVVVVELHNLRHQKLYQSYG